MADFCTRCSKDMFPPDTKPDIDLVELSKIVDIGYSFGPLLCEGCGYVRVLNDEGTFRVYQYLPGEETDEDIDIKTLPTLEDFIKLPMPNINH